MGDAALGIGRRILVTGMAGSGKSTFSRSLAAKTGWVAPPEPEGGDTQSGLLAGDAWIADGNYHETLDLRLERADTVVVLDMPWWRCSARAFLRGFRMPGELPEGCEYSAWSRLRDEWRLAVRIWRKRRSEPEREHEIISQHGQHVAHHVLRSKRAVREFLDGLDADHMEADDQGSGAPFRTATSFAAGRFAASNARGASAANHASEIIAAFRTRRRVPSRSGQSLSVT